MATPTSAAVSDEERRARIIAHMNRDHTREIGHYLRHLARLSPRAVDASPPTLLDVSLRGIVVRAGGTDYDLPFSPSPLPSWADVAPRLIAMDAAAREALGLSDIYITEYAPPRAGLDGVLFGAVIFYFACAAGLPWVVPGSALWDALGVVFPGGPEWFRWIVRAIFVPVVAIHVTECVLFDRWRLRRHGVARGSSVWWLWVSSCFIEGVTAWWRIDSIIAEKRKQKEAKKR